MALLLKDRLSKYSTSVGDCIEWSGHRNKDGYGVMRLRPADSPTGTRTMVGAHRVSFFISTGVWAEETCHTCDNPACIRIEHLYAGDRASNMRDRLARGNHPMAARTHCAQGHLFSEENTRYTKPNTSHPNGQRVCKICSRAAVSRSYFKAKEGGQ